MHPDPSIAGAAGNAPACLLSVVIPLFREQDQLALTVRETLAALASLPGGCELLLVDDGSPDGTWAAVRAHCEADARVRGIRLSRNFGKEAALAAGLEAARGQAVVVMDGDLQHPPALIPRMVEAWRAGAQVVEAVKRQRGPESLRERLRAQAFYAVFRRMSGQDLQGASDFKLLDRRVVEAWRAMGERNLFFRGMSAWLGFSRVQIPFDVAVRSHGASRWSLLQLVRLALTAVTSFSSAPLQLVTAAGLGFTALAALLAVQTLYMKLSGRAVDGFTTVILLLLIIGGIVMLALGIIGTYLARIYDEVKGRPRYVVADRAG